MYTTVTNHFQQQMRTQGQTAVSPATGCAQQTAQPHPLVTPGSKQKILFAAFFIFEQL
jgi:hypothetical protein